MLFSALSTPCSKALENSLSILRPHTSIWKRGQYLFFSYAAKERGGTFEMRLPPRATLLSSWRWEMGRTESHEAPPGKLQYCFRLPGKLRPWWKEGKMSFPSSLGQNNSSPLIAQSELELSERVFILMTQPQVLPGLDVFQEGCTDVHCPSQG